ncbi:polysaccharide deacetylase family protein [Rheinheimera riviphila]|uniref:polysaccharide deacetylase family protein n=1 Tax=Rheinheimera riviphila TaxID=1834037 RepID=UPI0013E3DBCA|nr:polysaccharide deacetylase family protein [Rheinheimera riviphila]
MTLQKFFLQQNLKTLICLTGFVLAGCAGQNSAAVQVAPIKVCDQARVVLSFDDSSVDDWYASRDIFTRYNVKATFFVSRFGKKILRSSDATLLNKLTVLRDDGHEIGYHSTSHKNAKLLSQQGVSWKQYYQKEIAPDLALLRQHGFAPQTFAYPFGAEVPAFTKQLKQHFSRVRGFTTEMEGKKYFKNYQKYRDPFLQMAFSIDSHRLNFAELALVLDELHSSCGTLILASHKIVDRPATDSKARYRGVWAITRADLATVIEMVQARNIRMVTFNQLI